MGRFWWLVLPLTACGARTDIGERPPTSDAHCAHVVEVSAGVTHNCARLADDTLWCFGSRALLGDGVMHPGYAMVQALPSVAHVSAGFAHTCAIEKDGTLWCWGGNMSGQLGDGTTDPRATPTRVTAIGEEVTEVTASMAGTCVRESDGTVWCWGGGWLGDGKTNQSNGPVRPAGFATATSVSLGAYSTCVLADDGAVYCWGQNVAGEVGDGTTQATNTPTPVVLLGANVADLSVGDHRACARMTGGTLFCWGDHPGNGSLDERLPVRVDALGSRVAHVSAGYHSTCAVETDGTLWCWGDNSDGALGDGTTQDSVTPVQVSALGAAVTDVSVGDGHACAVEGDGTLWCWGNLDGQLPDGTIRHPLPVQMVAFCK